MKSPIFFDGAKLFVSVLEAIYEVRQILVSHLEAFQNTGNVKEKVESDVSNDTLQTTPQGNPGTVLVDDVWMEPGSLCEFFGREKPPTAKFPSLDFVSGSLLHVSKSPFRSSGYGVRRAEPFPVTQLSLNALANSLEAIGHRPGWVLAESVAGYPLNVNSLS